MEQARFFAALIRLLSVYLTYTGFVRLIHDLTYLLAWRSHTGTGGPAEWFTSVLQWGLLISCGGYFVLAAALFVAAPLVAKWCLGRGGPVALAPAPRLESVLLFASGLIVAALSLMEAASILVAPLLESLKPEYERQPGLTLRTDEVIQGLLALGLAGAGLWLMLHFNRVHA